MIALLNKIYFEINRVGILKILMTGTVIIECCACMFLETFSNDNIK